MTDGTPTPLDGQGTAPGDISVHLLADRTQLVFTGEIDVSLNAVLVSAVEEAITRGVPVDLDVSAVTFMDSAAIAMVARLAYAMTVPPRVIDPPEPVCFLLDVTKVSEVVEVVTTVDGGAPEFAEA